MSKLKVISLYGGPGTGKSTTAAGLFNKMKLAGYKVELVTEFAKDLVYANREDCLNDQLYVFAKQQNRLRRLEGKVDWVVTDSPLLLSLVYGKEYQNLHQLVLEVYNKYDNYNFYLERVKDYQKFGRNQTEDEARQLDKDIERMFIKHGFPNKIVIADSEASDKIFKSIDRPGLGEQTFTIELKEEYFPNLNKNNFE